ncbi:leucyl/phenylalanyl-tRNA--protein transferase [Idiomarina xiamenensis]|uniref:Leucyl/phenylalanyl-tRNA--protein transferase n=1 Tax=Idiomarina xiamenensis 10-D-4 TaxID=740709 RepID=K2KQQ6_9GAMM|nr:leucyl/phenylalanyl-tRNA--protein transferase [Idiomarina xiamenensis]EKE79840.1 leucyl/phenylalanyl-tRNA--protein transferase [Idiomarina xiamenensis 10-D-4]
MIIQLPANDFTFPPPASALREPNGLLAVGGDLRPQRLIAAYEQGIFPWFGEQDPILWWSPDPRAVFDPAQIHASRSLRKQIRQSHYRCTINHAFSEVINACAEVRAAAEGTWINANIIEAFCALHSLGYAHSVEIWDDTALVGGLYGVSIGSLFCGESMFHRRDDASKMALTSFAAHFLTHGGRLIDCQIENPHLLSLGASQMPRQRFLQILHIARHEKLDHGMWLPQSIALTCYGLS